MKKIALLLLSISLVGCGSSTPREMSKTLDIPYKQVIGWDDSLSQKEKSYLVFYFKYSCKYCRKIMADILDFYYYTDTIMYFVDTSIKMVAGDDPDALIGIDNIEDLYILGTPSLYKIDQWTVSEVYIGADVILDYIKNK